MKKYPFRITVKKAPNMDILEIHDTLRWKYVKKYMQRLNIDYEFSNIVVEVFALYNDDYRLIKEYKYYDCICETVKSLLGNEKAKTVSIYTTSEQKALEQAFKYCKKHYHFTPTLISC